MCHSEPPALYECTHCHEVRTYGAGLPTNPRYQPQLYCSHCKTTTPHYFRALAPVFDTAEALLA